MKKNEWLIIIGAMVVIAILASLATFSITGNAIKVQRTAIGYDVYTKAEIDSKFARIPFSKDFDVGHLSVVEKTENVAPGKGYSAEAACPNGKFLLDGGCYATGKLTSWQHMSLMDVDRYHPQENPALMTSTVICNAYNSGNITGQIIARAYCVDKF